MEKKKETHFTDDTANRQTSLLHMIKNIIISLIVFLFIIFPYKYIGKSYVSIIRFILSKVGPLLFAHKRVVDNLNLALPELSDGDKKNIAQKSWENIAALPYEFISTRYDPKSLTIQLYGQEILEQLQNENKQILFFSGHNACWEIIRPYLYQYYHINTAIIYRPFNNNYLDNYARHLMNHGFAPVFQKTSIGIRKMIKHIKDKNHVFMLTDQRLGSGEAVNFFGQPAMTTPSAAELAIKYNMALIPIFTVRKSIGNYEIHLQPPMNLLTEIENPKVRIRNIIQKMNDVIEAHIRQFPNDWFWLHRRWK